VPRRRVVLAAAAGVLVVAAAVAVLFVVVGSGDESGGTAVPSVVGLEQSAAEGQLVNNGYSTQIVRAPSAKPAGTVVSQQPGAGSKASPGTIVELTVSSGEGAAAGTEPTETQGESPGVVVLKAVGRHQILAGADLERLGFIVDTYPVASNAVCGTVIAQEPAAGTRAARGTTIRLRVSLGTDAHALVTVPGLLGEASQARQAAREFGFTVRTQTQRARSGDEVGQVIAQRPGALTDARELSQITVVVGR
jgi:eukaryotic-like serine/threonine-protein kinase